MSWGTKGLCSGVWGAASLSGSDSRAPGVITSVLQQSACHTHTWGGARAAGTPACARGPSGRLCRDLAVWGWQREQEQTRRGVRGPRETPLPNGMKCPQKHLRGPCPPRPLGPCPLQPEEAPQQDTPRPEPRRHAQACSTGHCPVPPLGPEGLPLAALPSLPVTPCRGQVGGCEGEGLSGAVF